MKIENVIAGLQILVEEGATGYCVAAEHDVLYAGQQEKQVSLTARKRLLDLGWHWDTEVESWAAFT